MVKVLVKKLDSGRSLYCHIFGTNHPARTPLMVPLTIHTIKVVVESIIYFFYKKINFFSVLGQRRYFVYSAFGFEFETYPSIISCMEFTNV